MSFDFSIDQRNALEELLEANTPNWADFMLMSAMKIKGFEKISDENLLYAIGKLEDNHENSILSLKKFGAIVKAIPKKRMFSIYDKMMKEKPSNMVDKQKKLTEKQEALVDNAWSELGKTMAL